MHKGWKKGNRKGGIHYPTEGREEANTSVDEKPKRHADRTNLSNSWKSLAEQVSREVEQSVPNIKNAEKQKD